MNNNSESKTLLVQAMAWLDNMKIAYDGNTIPGFWSFQYKGLDLHLSKDCGYDKIGLYGMVFIIPENDDHDETVYRMIYDFAEQFARDTFLNKVGVQYCSDGLCLVYNWWQSKDKHNRLYKYRFVEMLDAMHEIQDEFHFALKCAEHALFNPPREVLEAIFNDTEPSAEPE